MKKSKTSIELDDNLIIAENSDLARFDDRSYYERRRSSMKELKIRKLTWGVEEIYLRFTTKKLNLQPSYQRREIWDSNKQTQYIESLILNIMTPPIYLAEVKSRGIVGDTAYEVVDGQQRLTSILKFLGAINGTKFLLSKNGLEYFKDIFSDKDYVTIHEEFPEYMRAFLSNTIDVYVISLDTPPDIKYDIFARLNKGSEKLTEAELRRAIYISNLTNEVDNLLCEISKNDDEYKKAFTPNDIKRFKDYNRIFKSFAYCYKYNESTCTLEEYNSRPRDLINNVMHHYQKTGSRELLEQLKPITAMTIKLLTVLKGIDKKENENKVLSHIYYVDTLIPFHKRLSQIDLEEFVTKLNLTVEFRETFGNSATTTTVVNNRYRFVSQFIESYENDKN